MLLALRSLWEGAAAPAVPVGGSQFGSSVPRGRMYIGKSQRPQIRPVRVRPARPQPVVSVPVVDDSDALVALYAAGAIDLEEFAALIAA